MNYGKEDQDSIGRCEHPDEETGQSSSYCADNGEIDSTDCVTEKAHGGSANHDTCREHSCDNTALLLSQTD